MTIKILVVDDNPDILDALDLLLGLQGYEVVTASNLTQAVLHVQRQSLSLVIQDMNFSPGVTSGEEGQSLFRQIKQINPTLPVLLITAWTKLSTAIELVKQGAVDYLPKPWDDQKLLQLVAKYALKPQQSFTSDTAILYKSQVMAHLLAQAKQVAATDFSLMITGPNGSGKELLTDFIHQHSSRSDAPLVKVNMGALPADLMEAELFGAEKGAFTGANSTRKGRFELADGGTIMLDEMGNLPLSGQMKLLRVLQSGEFESLGSSHTKKVDVRVICATNADLKRAVAVGEFREDLYYRINVVELALPPLNKRVEDIECLAKSFIGDQSLSDDALKALKSHDWPGNVRELQNVCQRASIFSQNGIIEAKDLFSMPVVDEKQRILDALNQHHWVIAKAADTLGLSRQALYRRIEKIPIGAGELIVLRLIILNLIFIFAFWLSDNFWLLTTLAGLLIWLAGIGLIRFNARTQMVEARLHDGLLNLLDGHYAVEIKEDPHSPAIFRLFNQLTNQLADHRGHFYQREELLDKVVNSTQVYTLIVNHRQRVIFANRPALKGLPQSKSIVGTDWQEYVVQNLPKMEQVLLHGKEGIVSIQQSDNAPQSWHFSNHPILIQDQACQLLMLKPVTEALKKQEIQTWKKVVRVINHELNNSLAPISSLCHSGGLLAEQHQEPKLNRVFAGIGRRVEHLSRFIRNYSQLAHVGQPAKQSFELKTLLKDINTLYPFQLSGVEGPIHILADSSQLEQVLINLLKNAHESHQKINTTQAVEVSVELSSEQQLTLKITDFGTGMSESELNQAFVPFYTTKDQGSGIGLAISREVIQAHGGDISLTNHQGGGLLVEIQLPL